MQKIVVAGVGPGGQEYILPIVKQKAAEADVLVGGKRALAPFQTGQKELIELTGRLAGLEKTLRNLAKTKKVLVLVSGDPGFYSLLAYLRRFFAPEDLEVYPGVSSVQVAFARLCVPWQKAKLLSVHGRDAAEILPDLLAPGVKAVLTDNHWTPGRLARLILAAGGSDSPVYLCRHLTTPKEEIVQSSLSELSIDEEGDCVMVIGHV
ncbi:MAG: precorrin-6y C5,15-methyltransferase (decarboxylating) subunit CbiE [Firmicutes bacterium]|nr:precorrin-6y C5,15-methyltransferase (decarboxylating) subunit CbiE [Bacillota bacterium]